MTQSVQSGSFITISVPAGHTVTVSADSVSAGNVYQQSNSQLLGAVASSGSLEIGPYSDTRGYIVVATIGALTYGEPVLSVDGGGGGGASAFTDLSDAPATIVPSAVVIGNDAGDALRMSDILTINENGVFEITEDGDAGIVISADGGGGLSISGNGSGGVLINANGNGGLHATVNGDGGLTISGDEDCGGMNITNASLVNETFFRAETGGIRFAIYNAGQLKFDNLTNAGSTAFPANYAAALRVTCDGTDYLIPLIPAA